MATQPELDQFDAGVYQLEKTDPVLGGVGGVVNSPFINLANRTRYLYNRIQEILGISKVYVLAGGTANAITAAYTPAVTALVDGQIVRIKSGFANTGAVTFTPNATGTPPIAPSPVYGRDHQPLTGGEFAVNGQNSLAWNASLNAGAGGWVLVENTGGAQRGASGASQAHLATVAQIQSAGYAADTGAANAYVVALAPAVGAYSDGMKVRFLVANSSTGASTLNVSGVGAVALVGAAHAALQKGELFAGGYAEAEYNAGLAKFVLLECTGAPSQISPGTASQHAVQFGQIPAVVGTVRNARMFVQTASANGTYTADEVVIESALGGLPYRLSGINKTINLATTGAGGMDTGAAPVNGFVGVYLIYNPTTQASALLATSAAALLGSVYGGANMPAGYTASALIGVMATNGSSQFKPFYLRDRKVNIGQSQAISTATASGAPVALSVSSIVPLNALSVCGGIGLNSTATSNVAGSVVSEAVSSIGTQGVSGSGTAVSGNYDVDLTVAQFIYYTFASSAGTPTFVITIVAYRF